MKQTILSLLFLLLLTGCHTRGIAEDQAVEQDRQDHAERRAQALVQVYPGGPSWPSFRGPERDGVSNDARLLKSWPKEGPPQQYRQPIGGGYASFAIADGRAFTIEQRRDKEIVSAYQLKTGIELWTHSYDAFFQERLGGDGPRATPTWSDGRIYSMGAQGDLFCLDATTGQKQWHRNILQEKKMKNLNNQPPTSTKGHQGTPRDNPKQIFLWVAPWLCRPLGAKPAGGICFWHGIMEIVAKAGHLNSFESLFQKSGVKTVGGTRFWYGFLESVGGVWDLSLF